MPGVKLISFTLGLALIAYLFSARLAQADATPTPTPDPLASLRLDATRAQLQSQIAQYDQTTRQALFGTQVQPVAGTLTVDANISGEVVILAYDELMQISQAMSKKVLAFSPKTLVLVSGHPTDNSAVAAAETYRNLISKILGDLQTANKDAENALRPPGNIPAFAPLAIMGAADALQAALSVAALFRSNVDVKTVTVPGNDDALISMVAGSLRNQKDKPTVIVSNFQPADSPILKSLADATIEISKTATYTRRINELLKRTSDTATPKPTDSDTQKKYQPILDELTSATNEYQGAMDALQKSSSIFGVATSAVIQADLLLDTLGGCPKTVSDKQGNAPVEKKGNYALFLKTVFLGGSNWSKQNVLWNSLSHSGTAVAEFRLVDGCGEVVTADTYYLQSGLVKVNNSDKAQNLPHHP